MSKTELVARLPLFAMIGIGPFIQGPPVTRLLAVAAIGIGGYAIVISIYFGNAWRKRAARTDI